MRRLGVLLLLFAFLGGCVSIDRDTRHVRAALQSNQREEAQKYFEKMKEGSAEEGLSQALYEVEAARVGHLLGAEDEAAGLFRKAVDRAIDRSENEPELRLTSLGANALASTMMDDRVRAYGLSAYEVNFALLYAILSQEALGLREDALVDARLAVYAQDQLAETYGADLEKARAAVNEDAQKMTDYSMKDLETVMEATRNSWENPVLWWLTGVLFETNRETEMAVKSYEKAAAVSPGNAFFQAEAATVRSRRALQANEARLIVIAQEGLISERKNRKLVLPIYTAISVDIPYYADAPYVPPTASLAVDGRTVPLTFALNVQSLAYRDLKERMPGVMARNIARALSAAAMQAAAQASGDSAVKVSVALANLTLALMRSSDLRSWRTLPMGVYVTRVDPLPAGERRVRVTCGERVLEKTLTLKPGETRVWLCDFVP